MEDKNYVGFLREIYPQDKVDWKIYEGLLEITKDPVFNGACINLTKIDASPSDMPSGSIFENYFSVSAPEDKVETVKKLLNLIEEKKGKINSIILDKLFKGEEVTGEEINKLIKQSKNEIYTELGLQRKITDYF